MCSLFSAGKEGKGALEPLDMPSPNRHPKRGLEDADPWRVRRPLCELLPPNAEPRVELSAPQQRTGTALQPRKPTKPIVHKVRALHVDPLEVIGQRAERSKEQVDALEKMLHSAMPPRVVLDNGFAGLRNAIADEIETALEDNWVRGVKHGEWLAQQKITDLEAKLLEKEWITAGAFLPLDEKTDEEEADLATDLAKFLTELPPDSLDSPLDIDLNALEREIDSISGLCT